ncbi:MAG: cellulase family glycosylhydrolase [Prevotella sp.]
MKKIYLTLILACGLTTADAQDNPRLTTCGLNAAETAYYMAPGWNLGNTLEAGSSANNFTNKGGMTTETSWQSTKTTQAIIDLVKSSGFKTVRIPCSWVMGHLKDSTTMTIDPDWLARVKEVVDYCIKDGLFVILNDHWDGGWLEYDGFTTGADVTKKKEQLRLLWTNIATAFKDYDGHLLFAGMNEPGVGGASPAVQGSLMVNQYNDDTAANETAFANRILEYAQVFIDAVRATGGNNAQRVLIVQGPKVSATKTAKYLDVSKLIDSASKRLMVEIHCYDPYRFCQMTEDATWGKIEYYWTGHAPARASSDRIGSTSEQQAIQTAFNNMKTTFVDKGYPVILGEYGATARTLSTTQGNQAKHNESRQYWFNFATDYAMSAGMVPICWDINNSGAKIIDRANVKVGDDYDLNGIKEGVEAAQKAYTTIYPEPSSTSGIKTTAILSSESDNVYDLNGRVVAKKVKSISKLSLPSGVYIFKGKKVVR